MELNYEKFFKKHEYYKLILISQLIDKDQIISI